VKRDFRWINVLKKRKKMQKRHAELGQWKTPPNQVYAQQGGAFPPDRSANVTFPFSASAASSSSSAAVNSLGTKMQLMGLVQRRNTPPAMNATSAHPILQAAAFPSSAVEPSPTKVSATFLAHSTPLGSTVMNSQDFGSVEKAKSKKSTKKSAAAVTTPVVSTDFSSGSPNGDSSKSKTKATPEERQRMLAHSRTMARLRRQQQRVLTDSLESEFFELCISSAYLKAVLLNSPSNRPLQSDQVDVIFLQATERSIEAMSSNIPSARSQELKSQVGSGKNNVPQAHFVPSLKLDEPTSIHLAVTVGSRRESLSFSTQRRKGALEWATEGVKDLLGGLKVDALPSMLAGNCVVGENDDLAGHLKLSQEQKEKIARLMPDLREDLTAVLAAERAAQLLFSDAWLSLPKTDSLMDQVRDTITGEQMSKLISWSITNESQIATLKLGSQLGTGH
jgi:hypothetical protein